MNSIPVRIIIFYVLALVIVMSVTPWNRIDPTVSPFVNLFSQAGNCGGGHYYELGGAVTSHVFYEQRRVLNIPHAVWLVA